MRGRSKRSTTHWSETFNSSHAHTSVSSQECKTLRKLRNPDLVEAEVEAGSLRFFENICRRQMGISSFCFTIQCDQQLCQHHVRDKEMSTRTDKRLCRGLRQFFCIVGCIGLVYFPQSDGQRAIFWCSADKQTRESIEADVGLPADISGTKIKRSKLGVRTVLQGTD